MFGFSEEEIAQFGLTFGVSAFMLYMVFIIFQLASESKAGRFGTFVLLLALGFGLLGFVAKGVTVNTVSPGYIGTDMVRAIKPEVLEKIVATIPVKRLGTPEEIGSIVAWLAGDDSGFTTGADFSCNGGLHMG